MTELLLDGGAIPSREALHDAFARGLALPPYYGRNLDALFDCLTDRPEDTRIRLVRPELLEARLGPYARALDALLRRAAEENPRIAYLPEPSGPEGP